MTSSVLGLSAATVVNPLTLQDIKKEQRRVTMLLRNSRQLPPSILKYRKRQQAGTHRLGQLKELPEDSAAVSPHTRPDQLNGDYTTRHYALHEADENALKKLLASTSRNDFPDVRNRLRLSYDGVVRPCDISQFDSRTLMNRSLAELLDNTNASGRSRLPSLNEVLVDGHVRSLPRLTLRRGNVVLPTGLVDGRTGLKLPKLMFSPNNSRGNDSGFGRFWSPRSDPLDFDHEQSHRWNPANRRGTRSADDGWIDVGVYSSTGRRIHAEERSCASSLSDVSTLQRLYGSRISTTKSRMTSGTSRRSAAPASARFTTTSSRCCSGTTETQRNFGAHADGRRGKWSDPISSEQFRSDVETNRPTASSEEPSVSGDAVDQQTVKTRQNFLKPVVVAPKKEQPRRRTRRNGGQISRAFVFSYFSLLPGLGRQDDQQPGAEPDSNDNDLELSSNKSLTLSGMAT